MGKPVGQRAVGPSPFTVAVKSEFSTIPSRFAVLKPVSENVTEYVPGTRLGTWYLPPPSVTVVRTFSIRAGLATSTVTPGSTAPDESNEPSEAADVGASEEVEDAP